MSREKAYLYLAVVALVAGLAVLPFRGRADEATEHTATSKPEAHRDAPNTSIAHAPAQAFGKNDNDGPEPEIPEGKFGKFRQLTEKALDALPLLEDVEAKAHRDPHFAPSELFASSPSLGAIATSLKENPELIPQGIQFYDECARREGVLSAVRILCLRNLRHWSKQQPDVLNVDRGDYPIEIWDVAESLPPVRY